MQFTLSLKIKIKQKTYLSLRVIWQNLIPTHDKNSQNQKQKRIFSTQEGEDWQFFSIIEK